MPEWKTQVLEKRPSVTEAVNRTVGFLQWKIPQAQWKLVGLRMKVRRSYIRARFALDKCQSPPHPYRVGSTLALNFTPEGSSTPVPVLATVTEAFEPFTWSPVVRVSLSSAKEIPSLPSEAILKVYDRRSHDVREHLELGPYTGRKERKYRRFVAKGGIPEEDLRIGGLTIGENEAILENECRKGFESETAIYRHLPDLQGKHIPKLYGTISLSTKGVDSRPFEVCGLLIEYIPGFQLFKLEESEFAPPKESWEKIGNEVVSILKDLDGRNVLNNDPSTRNIMIAKEDHRVVMIDFAQARIRRDDETDEEWELAKGSSCEEARIAGTLRNRGILKEWVPSEQHMRYCARRAEHEACYEDSDE